MNDDPQHDLDSDSASAFSDAGDDGSVSSFSEDGDVLEDLVAAVNDVDGEEEAEVADVDRVFDRRMADAKTEFFNRY